MPGSKASRLTKSFIFILVLTVVVLGVMLHQRSSNSENWRVPILVDLKNVLVSLFEKPQQAKVHKQQNNSIELKTGSSERFDDEEVQSEGTVSEFSGKITTVSVAPKSVAPKKDDVKLETTSKDVPANVILRLSENLSEKEDRKVTAEIMSDLNGKEPENLPSTEIKPETIKLDPITIEQVEKITEIYRETWEILQ